MVAREAGSRIAQEANGSVGRTTMLGTSLPGSLALPPHRHSERPSAAAEALACQVSEADPGQP